MPTHQLWATEPAFQVIQNQVKYFVLTEIWSINKVQGHSYYPFFLLAIK